MEKTTKDKQDMASHKIIEKRRRDRINNCLLELTQAVPAAFSKQNSGKLEKAEILEMTVEYLRAVHDTQLGLRLQNGEWYTVDIWSDFLHHYQTGYSDCMKEVIRYLDQIEGIHVNDTRCSRILTFLQSRFKADNSVTSGLHYRQLCTTNDIMTYGQPSTKSPVNLPVQANRYQLVSTTGPSRSDRHLTPRSAINRATYMNQRATGCSIKRAASFTEDTQEKRARSVGAPGSSLNGTVSSKEHIHISTINRATSIIDKSPIPDANFRLGFPAPKQTQKYFPYSVTNSLMSADRAETRGFMASNN